MLHSPQLTTIELLLEKTANLNKTQSTTPSTAIPSPLITLPHLCLSPPIRQSCRFHPPPLLHLNDTYPYATPDIMPPISCRSRHTFSALSRSSTYLSTNARFPHAARHRPLRLPCTASPLSCRTPAPSLATTPHTELYIQTRRYTHTRHTAKQTYIPLSFTPPPHPPPLRQLHPHPTLLLFVNCTPTPPSSSLSITPPPYPPPLRQLHSHPTTPSVHLNPSPPHQQPSPSSSSSSRCSSRLPFLCV